MAIAQKFVGQPAIVMELGDFSSAASMAASPIYERGKLVQFGFTNSHPDFTKGGDYMWSNAPNQADDMPMLAAYAAEARAEAVRVAFIDSDWGTHQQGYLRQGGGDTRDPGDWPARDICRTTRISARCWCGCVTPSRTG